MLYYLLEKLRYFQNTLKKPNKLVTNHNESSPNSVSEYPNSWSLVKNNSTRNLTRTHIDLRIPIDITKKCKFIKNQSFTFIIFYPTLYSKNIENVVSTMTCKYYNFECLKNSNLNFIVLTFNDRKSTNYIKQHFILNQIHFCKIYPIEPINHNIFEKDVK